MVYFYIAITTEGRKHSPFFFLAHVDLAIVFICTHAAAGLKCFTVGESIQIILISTLTESFLYQFAVYKLQTM